MIGGADHGNPDKDRHCIVQARLSSLDTPSPERVRWAMAVTGTNLALLRKIAPNIVGRDRTTKASMRARRKRAAWNDTYILKLLAK